MAYVQRVRINGAYHTRLLEAQFPSNRRNIGKPDERYITHALITQDTKWQGAAAEAMRDWLKGYLPADNGLAYAKWKSLVKAAGNAKARLAAAGAEAHNALVESARIAEDNLAAAADLEYCSIAAAKRDGILAATVLTFTATGRDGEVLEVRSADYTPPPEATTPRGLGLGVSEDEAADPAPTGDESPLSDEMVRQAAIIAAADAGADSVGQLLAATPYPDRETTERIADIYSDDEADGYEPPDHELDAIEDILTEDWISQGGRI